MGTSADLGNGIKRVDVKADEVPLTPKPSTVPDKFKKADGSLDHDKLLASYTELEGKLGKPADKQTTTPPDAPKGVDADTLTALRGEFAKDGKLSDKSYQELAAKGVTKEIADGYIAGQVALAQNYAKSLHDSAGGEQEFSKIIDWAGQSLSEKAIEEGNKILKSGNTEAAATFIAGLKAQMQAALGVDPALVNGGSTRVNAGAQPFRSNEELVSAMKDPRYRSDPAYREDVYKRLAVSK